MDLAAAYARRKLPEPALIMGECILPVTIGHGLLLQQIGSPFTPFWRAAEAEREPMLGDVLAAVFILSRPHHVALHQLCSGWFRFVMWIWAVRLRVVLWFCPWRSVLVPEIAGQIHEFIRMHCLGPKLWVEPGDGKPRGSPDLGLLLVSLMLTLGKTEDAALATPISAAIWDCSIAWEIEGRVRISTIAVEGWKPPVTPAKSDPASASPESPVPQVPPNPAPAAPISIVADGPEAPAAA